VGYNHQFDGNFVLGAEVDANFSGANSDNNAFPAILGLGLTASSDLKWFGSARLRAGYAFDRLLPFLTGGVAFADYSGKTNDPANGKISDTRVGWTVGAGLEYAITNNLIARIEYRYADYGRDTRSGPFAAGGDPVRLDLKTSDVRVGISYKF
jgi:outer membrane immunogenic protein